MSGRYKERDDKIAENSGLARTFFTAAERRDYQTIRDCLKMGINPNMRNAENYTVLHIAATNGDPVLAEYLVHLEDIDINCKTLNFEFTPLHTATRHERASVIKILLDNAADVNAVNRNGITCLHFAVAVSNTFIIKLLLKYGADVNRIDTFSHTPLSMAVLDIRNYAIANLLLEWNANVNLARPFSIPLFYEVILNFPDPSYIPFLHLLHQHGADPNEIDISGRNGMHYAALNGSSDLVIYLNAINCAANKEDATHRTPFDIAVDHGNFTMARILKTFSSNTPSVDIKPEPSMAFIKKKKRFFRLE